MPLLPPLPPPDGRTSPTTIDNISWYRIRHTSSMSYAVQHGTIMAPVSCTTHQSSHLIFIHVTAVPCIESLPSSTTDSSIQTLQSIKSSCNAACIHITSHRITTQHTCIELGRLDLISRHTLRKCKKCKSAEDGRHHIGPSNNPCTCGVPPQSRHPPMHALPYLQRPPCAPGAMQTAMRRQRPSDGRRQDLETTRADSDAAPQMHKSPKSRFYSKQGSPSSLVG